MPRKPYGGVPPFIKSRAISKAASTSMIPHAVPIQLKIRQWVRSLGYEGATICEVETHFGLRNQTTSPRVRELYLQGWLYDSGRRRPTDSRRQAIVWVCRDKPEPPPQDVGSDEARNLRHKVAVLEAELEKAKLDLRDALLRNRAKPKRTPTTTKRQIGLFG